MLLIEIIQSLILFGYFSSQLLAYAPGTDGWRLNSQRLGAANDRLPVSQRRNNRNNNVRPSISAPSQSPVLAPNNQNQDIRRSVPYQNPLTTVREERPGAYHIEGFMPRNIRTSESESIARIIPQVVAEPIIETPRILNRLRGIMRRNDRNNEIRDTEVEIEPEDRFGPLAQINGYQERRPITVEAKRIGWF